MIRWFLRFLGLWPKKSEEQYIENNCFAFADVLESHSNSYISHQDYLSIRDQWKSTYQKIQHMRIPKRHKYYFQSQSFLNTYQHLDDVVEKLNEKFITDEIKRCDALLSNIAGKSLDMQQRRVVVTDENRNLVIAGAGSGKTLTIVGKVKYLCEQKGIKPEDILLIAFTNKSADEMTERLNRLGIPVRAKTFHKFGLETIVAKTRAKPDVLQDGKLEGFIQSCLNKKLSKNNVIAKNLIEYFAYYFHVPSQIEQFSSMGEMYEHEKGQDLETIRGKYRKGALLREAAEKGDPLVSLQGETVKSRQEVAIANFLFLNGIEYQYEPEYPHVTPTAQHGSYHPDFFLPEYGIYIEHFGIDKNGRTPQYSEIEEEKYLADMGWKRKTHEEFGTILVETYSYYESEGRLLEELDRQLKLLNVVYKEPDYLDIFNALYPSMSEKYFPDFIKLCCTFITLLKSNGYQIGNLRSAVEKSIKDKSPFFVRRTVLFSSIIIPIISAYNDFLEEQNKIDFADMINHATRIICDNNYHPHSYKWVIVDEYQDISVARYKLIHALLNRTGAKLLCVGDDWQSIYRFAGSDISLFTQFEEYFGYSKIMKIEKTYRNSQELIDAAGAFVMKNPAQIPKALRSEKKLSHPLTFMHYQVNPTFILVKTLRKIISTNGDNSSIMLLGRTKNDLSFIENASDLFAIKEHHGQTYVIFHEHPKQKIFFLTVHKAKGLEADNVIVLNFRNDTLGFPNKIVDDPLLELVLTKGDSFMYAEERRLFYVAITRTKNRTFILTDKGTPSEFFKDFEPSQSVFVYTPKALQSEPPKCPRCKTGELTIRENRHTGTKFVGCSYFPQCDYTAKDTSIVINPKPCPICGGFIIKKKSQFGEFYGCINYPYCKFKREIPQ